MPSFLDESNIAGRTLLRLASRGSSIIGELSRLADHVPAPFQLPGALPPEERELAARFAGVLFDFAFFHEPDMYETRVSRDVTLTERDEECQQSYGALVARFYALFEGCTRYIEDIQKYFEDLSTGFYPSASLETVMLDRDGKQLACEVVGLWGTVLLLLDRRLPGPVRERLVVAHFRYRGEGVVLSIEEVQQLTRDTGFVPGGKRPEAYPDAYFARFPLPADVVSSVLGALRSEDVYTMQRAYPSPDHRSAALSQQAALAYVSLYFAPERLRSDRPLMREMVARHFPDNWVLHVYLGLTVDLSYEWAPYAAANEVLTSDTMPAPKLHDLLERAGREFSEAEAGLAALLREGTLTESYVLSHLRPTLDVVRRSNVVFKWILLHRMSLDPKRKKAVRDSTPGPKHLLQFLLNMSSVEFRLKGILSAVMDQREERFDRGKARVNRILSELSAYYAGEGPLASLTGDREESLAKWFTDLAGRVDKLDPEEPMLAGRKIQRVRDALRDVERLADVDGSTAAREHLGVARHELEELVRVLNITGETMGHIQILTDLSYAWGLLREFVPLMHDRISADASAVTELRATFLKLTSVLDVPLARITESGSRDAYSVAKHYSDKLENFLREVLTIIPQLVFKLLAEIAVIQTRHLRPLPVRLEAEKLAELAQLELRHELARRTHAVSVITQGVLTQEKTLLGVCSTDPRAILNDGIRQQLVVQAVRILDGDLDFSAALKPKRGTDPRAEVERVFRAAGAHLRGLQDSLEYIQDFIGVKGLRMWQEEYSRILLWYAEREANLYLQRRILPEESRHWNRHVPIPLRRSDPSKAPGTENFVGRSLQALRALTDPARTVYAPSHSGWFLPDGTECAGLGLFSLVESTVGVPGLAALDRVCSFRTARVLGTILRTYAGLTGPESTARLGSMSFGDALRDLAEKLHPASRLIPSGPKAIPLAASRLAPLFPSLRAALLEVGQLQLLRTHLAHKLRFSCRLDSNLLHTSLSALNDAVLTDVRRHYLRPDRPIPSSANPLLPELSSLAEATGLADPLRKLYLTCKPLPFLPLFLALLIVDEVTKLTWDDDFGTLVSRKPKDGTDGHPFLVGVVTLLRQFHPSYTRQCLEHLGQHIRTAVHHALMDIPMLRSKRRDMPAETIGLILLFQQLTLLLGLPRPVIHSFVPSYVLDGVAFSATPA